MNEKRFKMSKEERLQVKLEEENEYYKKIYDASIAAKAKLPQSREELEERKRKADVSMFETYGVRKSNDIPECPAITTGNYNKEE